MILNYKKLYKVLVSYGRLADARMMRGSLKSIMLNLAELLVPVVLKLRHAHYSAAAIACAHIADTVLKPHAKKDVGVLNSC